MAKAILEEFAKNGAKIFAHARKPSEEYNSFTDNLAKKYKTEIIPIYFDMTDSASMKSVLKNIILSKQNIDILINNAGIAHGQRFAMTPISKIKEVFEVNLFSQMELTQLVLKIMTKNNNGSIINIGSITGLDLPVGNSSYGVSKAALMAWTKTLALEVAPIRVNAIAPGITDTDMGNSVNPKALNTIINNSALKRSAKPEEIAKTVRYIASDDASFITGQIIRVDGEQYDR